MSSIVKGFIEYSGIAECLPQNPCSFKQFTLQENLMLSHNKPDIEQILKVMAEVIITNTRVIKTPVATSLEGQTLTGWKLIVEGEVSQKIEYVANLSDQPVYAAHFNTLFSSFIILPECFKISSSVNVTGYIEDIFVTQYDKRNIFKNVTILLDAVIYT
jgi:hypothetical protein